MTKVTIFGAGNMGSGIGSILTAGGADVSHITSSTTGATVDGDIVVLAVPYTAFDDIVSRYGDQLAGKIVVDITNPLDFTTFKLLPAPDSSAAAELAAKLPNSKVLKAFNTNFAATLPGKIGDQTSTVLVAGDDTDAKAQLGALVTAAGLAYLDAGNLSRARELEAVGVLQMSLAASGQISWTGGFATIR